MNKILVLLNTDNREEIEKFKRDFLKDGISAIPKGIAEIWEIDEENHMQKRIK